MMLLYFKLLKASIRSSMQHRASFIMLATAHFISTFVDILGIYILFDRFKMIQGWTFEEMALIYGVMHMGFAFSEAFGRGFDTFSQLVKSGDFDRLLLRPASPLLQVASMKFQPMRVGRFLQGLTVLCFACHSLGISLFSSHVLLIGLAVAGTAALFYGLLIIQATLSFWTIETLEIMNITTYGGMETGQYPITIYPTLFRTLFTFLIPMSLVGYYPVASLLKQEDVPLWIGYLAPLAGFLFLKLSTLLWEVGVRHYHSTGH